jgi:hypothetical protein
MKKIIPFFLALFCIAFLKAQSISLIKAEKALTDKKYEKCVTICEKGIQKDKTNVELLFVKTKAQYELSLITPQTDGETNYAKECIKSAIKAKAKDKEHEFTLQYKELFANIAKQNNQTALEIFNQETIEAKDMSKYSELLENSILEILGEKTQEGIKEIFSTVGKTNISKNVNLRGLDDFELISFLIIK